MNIKSKNCIDDFDLRRDANQIIDESIKNVLPDKAVKKALVKHLLSRDEYENKSIYVVSIGKAAWKMANACYGVLGSKIKHGFVVTKYDHVEGEIPNFECMEAGHPFPDENSYKSTKRVVDFVSALDENDVVIFLISGGGSAIFESPLIDGDELGNITNQLLSSEANIDEINTIRKRLSAVKGGKFAQLCRPAKIFSIVLSDVVGDRLDSIASGPAYPDDSTCKDALQIIERFNLKFSEQAYEFIRQETPKEIDNVETHITGSVRELCSAASVAANGLGYKSVILSENLVCQAKDAGEWLAEIARFVVGGDCSGCDDCDDLDVRKDCDYFDSCEFKELLIRLADADKVDSAFRDILDARKRRMAVAIIAGGETVVKVQGDGLGGRNQELALSAAKGISNFKNVAIFSVGSDGTDGPTDAAGGYVDRSTLSSLNDCNIDITSVLQNNDSYHALQACDGLIITGPTGTNVNDFACLLIR